MKKVLSGACALILYAVAQPPAASQNVTQFPPPTGLQPASGTVFPATTTAVTLSWNPVAGAAGYLLRAQDLTDPNTRYAGNTDNNFHYVFIDNYTGSTFSMPVQSGHSYTFWMHSITADFSYSIASTFSIHVGTTFVVATDESGALARSLSPSSTSVGAGGVVSVRVQDSHSTPVDWVAIAPVGSTATHIPGYWQYLGGAQTPPSTPVADTTLQFNMPSTAGQYEFRLFADNSGTVLPEARPLRSAAAVRPRPRLECVRCRCHRRAPRPGALSR